MSYINTKTVYTLVGVIVRGVIALEVIVLSLMWDGRCCNVANSPVMFFRVIPHQSAAIIGKWSNEEIIYFKFVIM